MADEELEEGGEGAKKESGGMMKIILIVNGVLLLVAIAVGITIFMMSGDDAPAPAQTTEEAVDTEIIEDAISEDEAGQAGNKKRRTPIYVALNPAFIVNFENQEQVSFLQVDIQIMTYNGAVEDSIKRHMPAVRNELLLLLGGKQYHEINTREGKRALSQECIQAIKGVLQQVNEPSDIEALYFTSFVMQ